MELISVYIDKKTAKKMRLSNWKFDWSISSGAISQKIGYFENNELQGLVEFERVPSSLFNFIYLIELAPWNVGKRKVVDNVAGTLLAFVAQDSLNAGFNGFVALHSKTILEKHYIDKYGARSIGGGRLVFDEQASRKLIARYLEDKNEKQK